MATGSTKAALERKAVSQDNKSEGLRMLFDEGYTVADARQVWDPPIPYGFAYGVASRHGVIDTAASRRSPAKPKAKSSAKTAAPKATSAKSTATTAKSSTAKATSKAPAAAKPAPRAATTSAARRKAAAARRQKANA